LVGETGIASKSADWFGYRVCLRRNLSAAGKSGGSSSFLRKIVCRSGGCAPNSRRGAPFGSLALRQQIYLFIEAGRFAITARLKQARRTIQISSGNDVLQGDTVTPHAFVPHGPEIISAILQTEAATVPVVSALDCFVLNGSEI
jgi:hypothetical protein